MPADDAAPDITALLTAWGLGDLDARNRLMPLVYEELRQRAQVYLRRERAGHTLQPTALVHEAFLRLIRQERVVWQSRAQFFGIAAQMMRRILVDHARAHKTGKRSGQLTQVSLDDLVASNRLQEIDVLDLHAALEQLASFDARKSQVAELRFFGGLSLQETAHVLDISVATVEREWQAGRAWLYSRLKSRRDET
jgi:RNA polymerase sigma factor (TIGR02999 family)